MNRDSKIIAAFDAVRCWEQGGKRAPNKPLLLLLALARIQRGEGRLIPYSEIENKLDELLVNFGPPRKVVHSEQPFWRLRGDGIWEVPDASEIEVDLTASGDAKKSVLRDIGARAGFTSDIFQYLTSKPELVNRLAAILLEKAFPRSMHEELLDSIGFPWVYEHTRRRDPHFREEILRIYEHRCAICGYDGRLGSVDLGIEAAHVKWHAAGGSDEADNGLALCKLHHDVLDRGGITLGEDLTVIVSGHVHGQTHVDSLLIQYSNKSLRKPQPGAPTPALVNIRWHRNEVFREPPRADLN